MSRKLSRKAPMQRIQESQKLLEKIMLVVPGFAGYKKREQRREADKIIRNFIYSKLHEARNTLQNTYQNVAEKHSEMAEFDLSTRLTKIDQLIAIFDRVSEKVNHASYGYHGFFDAIKIEEADLDRMIAFDTQLVNGAKGLAERVNNFKAQVEARKLDTFDADMLGLRNVIEGFERTFDERKDVIDGVEVG